jgi:hypothetical protein
MYLKKILNICLKRLKSITTLALQKKLYTNNAVIQEGVIYFFMFGMQELLLCRFPPFSCGNYTFKKGTCFS